MKYNTNWSKGSKYYLKAFWSMIQANKAGYNASVKRLDNKDLYYPIMVLNPLLNDMYNWQPNYGIPMSKEEYENYEGVNETETKLTKHYQYNYKTHKAVYKEFNHTSISIQLWQPKPDFAWWIPDLSIPKVWAVVIHRENQVHKLRLITRFIIISSRFFPKFSSLKMNNYTNYSFRWGSVEHGFEIEFQIPKKLSWKD